MRGKRSRGKSISRRYVYMMERVRGKDWESIKRGRREIKIGVSVDGVGRSGYVNDGIPGEVVFREQYLVDNAIRVERMLHDKYNEWNFVVKGAKKGAGGTEFFRLKRRQINEIRKILLKIEEEGFSKKWGEDPHQNNELIGKVLVVVFFISLIFMMYLKSF
jgi:hypothetical protein